MKDYIPKKNNKYYIGNKYLYKQVLYTVLGYNDMIKRREQILYSSPPPPDGLAHSNSMGDTTAKKAIALSTIDTQLKAIEQVITELNGKYSNTYTGEEFDAYEAFKDYGVYCWYRSRKNTDKAPCERTWKRYRSEFIYKVAKKLNYF